MGVTEWVQGQPENFSETSSQKLRARNIKSGGFRVLWMIKALCLICSAGGKKRKENRCVLQCSTSIYWEMLELFQQKQTGNDPFFPSNSEYTTMWKVRWFCFHMCPILLFFHVNIKANEMLKQCLNYHLASSQEQW